MDHQSIDEHLVTVAMVTGETTVIERAPINPIVYLEPPVLWLSGSLGPILDHRNNTFIVYILFITIFRN